MLVEVARPRDAVLRRRPGEADPDADDVGDPSVDLESDTVVAPVPFGRRRGGEVEVYPLSKKTGASFPDMITVGRTPNNDVVVRDSTVSRLHAFFKHKDGRWTVADGGSKNGTRLDGEPLEARREREVASGQRVRVGEIELTFYTAPELFDVLSS